MKIAGILLVLVSCTGLGIVKSNEMGQRLKLLREWHRILLLLTTEISYHTTLSDACQNVSRRTGLPFSDFLSDLSLQLVSCEGKSLAEIFSEAAEYNLNNCSLSGEDIGQIRMLGEMMQGADRALQKQVLERHSKELEITITELRVQLPGKQKLYRSLGILGGVFLGILLL